jgi:capsule polysaccharide export protein KpsE/RkpR
VTLHIKSPLDDEAYRLFALYEASSAKETAATYRLLNLNHRLPHREYMTLLGDLRSMRMECNEQKLAIEAHRTKMLEQTKH